MRPRRFHWNDCEGEILGSPWRCVKCGQRVKVGQTLTSAGMRQLRDAQALEARRKRDLDYLRSIGAASPTG